MPANLARDHAPVGDPFARRGIELTPVQRDAVEQVKNWFGADERGQVFRMFGYAGTGKTSLAQTVVTELGLEQRDVVYSAFTGKACHVLRQKGCHGARTIHSLIYMPVERSREEIAERRRTLAKMIENDEISVGEAQRVEREIAEDEADAESPGWVLNTGSELREAKLCVIDEVSMVNARMAEDLLSFDVPVLVLGDPAQLPPVRGTGWFMDAEPDVLLTEIHRSEAGSGVTKVATCVRTGSGRDFGLDGMLAGDDGVLSGRWHRALSIDQALRFDTVLCWRNDVRWMLIRKLRKAAGFTGDVPQPGERIIILANNRELGVYNGQEIDVEEVTLNDDGSLTVTGQTDGRKITVPVMASGFAGKKGQEDAEREARKAKGHSRAAAATFANAITVHKAQGSQWDKVLVVDETPGIFAMNDHTAARRWMYTAVTRAAKQVVVAPQVM